MKFAVTGAVLGLVVLAGCIVAVLLTLPNSPEVIGIFALMGLVVFGVSVVSAILTAVWL
jgi:hypothetical protein